MSERERLRVSFNMENAQHRAAWNAICQHPGKLRSEFVIACVNQIADEHRLENALSRLLDEKLTGISLQSQVKTANLIETADELPNTMLDFLNDF